MKILHFYFSVHIVPTQNFTVLKNRISLSENTSDLKSKFKIFGTAFLTFFKIFNTNLKSNFPTNCVKNTKNILITDYFVKKNIKKYCVKKYNGKKVFKNISVKKLIKSVLKILVLKKYFPKIFRDIFLHEFFTPKFFGFLPKNLV